LHKVTPAVSDVSAALVNLGALTVVDVRRAPFAPGETVRLDGAAERDAPAATPF
jgi:hypothetical protein